MRPYDPARRKPIYRVSHSQAEASAAPPVKKDARSQRAKTSSQKRELGSQTKEPRRFECTYDGCSYSARQKNNLNVHIKTHTGLKDQFCTLQKFSTSTDLCDFRCSDPSSIRRHIQRHTLWLEKGQTTSLPKQKQPPRSGRARAKAKSKRKKSQKPILTNLAGPSKLHVPFSLASNRPEVIKTFYPVPSQQPGPSQQRDPIHNVGWPIEQPLHGFLDGLPEVTAPVHQPVPFTAEAEKFFSDTLYSQPPQVQQDHFERQYYNDMWLDCLPDEYLTNWPPPSGPGPQSLPPPTIESGLDPGALETLSILWPRLDQLRPVLAGAQYPLSFEEVEGALFQLLERDGISPETFLRTSSCSPLFNAYKLLR